MNDLNLRVSGGIGEKVKKPAAPLSVPYFNTEVPGIADEFFSNFFSCKSADNQLKLLKQFLNSHKDQCEQETVRFLVLLFWHADAKHPVKGFLKKHITDSRTLKQPFTDTLTSVIAAEIENSTQPYGDYIGTVTRLDGGIDKFPPGADAVSTLEVAVTKYCVRCLEACIETLGPAEGNVSNEEKFEPLPPTEINKIYDLVHLTLRLLLYMIQKVTEKNRGNVSSMFGSIRCIIFELMTGKEVPMDTKSLSGIIYLTLHLFENGPGSWITLLKEDRSSQNGTVNLSIYSALATVLPPAELMAAELDRQPAILDLTDKILDIADRYSSSPSHTLAVARTLLALSRALSGAGAGAGGGAALAARLARWARAHVEHDVDSVRHLAAQLVARVAAAAVQLHTKGDSSVLEDLFTSVSTWDKSRKGLYVTLTALAEAGAGVAARRPDVIRDVIHALRIQAVQACATTFLETLLKKHMKESDTETIYRQWVSVILETVKRESDPTVLSILEKILAKAVQWDSEVLSYILPEERALSTYAGSDLKCILLVLGVVRKSGVPYKGVSFDDLRHTAYDADDEIRILSLSLISETPRSTQPLSADELAFTLHFLEYNVNVQSPSCRQLLLAHMKKILKRLEDSYKPLKRKQAEHEAEISSYLSFASELRAACFGSLSAGGMGNYGRRCVSLQLLSWTELLQLEGWERSWTEEEAEILYNLLEDSYENNKVLALEVLKNCPAVSIKPVQSPSYVAAAVAQASSVRPTDCVAASYKLQLLLSLSSEFTYQNTQQSVPSSSCFSLLSRLVGELKEQVSRARDVLRAARDAPMYGLVHCLAGLLGCLDASEIAGNEQWSTLVSDIIATCESVHARVESVVTAASPEGMLPEHSDQPDSSGGTRLADGRAVTAQMVLLCAWRSVKETSLLLGSLVSRLSLEGEAPSWTLSSRQVEHIGEHLITLLSTVKHRGAFEQAYVGFTLLLGRLWKCSSALHQLPLRWFSSIERGFSEPAEGSQYCATRRGAGLPFMIQALVTTELAAESTAPRGRLLQRCVQLCLSVARGPRGPGAHAREPRGPGDAARAHLVLRALHRHATPAAHHTAEAIMLAVKGFEAGTWTERNSSTLLLSALVVRVFGVARARAGGHALSARNTMTGRIFFLRYPPLYDFLLELVASPWTDGGLRPSLFPALLLLARLYPSALEGTVSNLKLSRFLPHLVSLSGARDASTRVRAARAAAALLPPHRCIAHMLSLLATLGDPAIKRNLCHGLLCQLTVLLELKPSLSVDDDSRHELQTAVRGTFWILQQPCFLVADEWLKLISLMMLRFPNLLDDDLATISSLLETVLFSPPPPITSGREMFLANAAYMSFLTGNTAILLRCLEHTDYEVNLAALNYILLLNGCCEDPCMFLEHLSLVSEKNTLKMLQSSENYVKLLCKVAGNGYLECKRKTLKILMLNNNQMDMVKLKLGKNEALSFETVVEELIDSIRNDHGNLTCIYLEALLSFVSGRTSLEVARVILECSSAGNEEATREVVVRYLEQYLGTLVRPMDCAEESKLFWCVSRAAAAAAMLLEDDARALRRRTAAAVLHAIPGEGSGSGLAAHAARRLRRFVASLDDACALLLVLAALDFCAHVDSSDELGEEYRVFEQNETHNVFLEEFTWSKECALELKQIHRQTSQLTIQEYLQSILSNPRYKDTIEELCIDNVAEYLLGQKTDNPKINLFLKILYE